jgi:hypothetical protein
MFAPHASKILSPSRPSIAIKAKSLWLADRTPPDVPGIGRAGHQGVEPGGLR